MNSQLLKAHDLTNEFLDLCKEIYEITDKFVRAKLVPVAKEKGYKEHKLSDYDPITQQVWKFTKPKTKYEINVHIYLGKSTFQETPIIEMVTMSPISANIAEKLNLRRPRESFRKFIEAFERIYAGN